ncbi:MAG: aldo/keto reductase [Pseudomonadota bacterium]
MTMARLGRSGLQVSRLCLGTMTFGGRTDRGEAGRIYALAREHGINFLDTADAYTGGRSEEMTGELVAGERDRIIIASKLANAIGDDINHRGLSRSWILTEVPRILKRLGTDYLDILYLHKEDHGTPMDETVRALEDLVRAGAIRHIGVSNHKAWRVGQMVRFCDEANITRPVVSQPLYHALNRTIEVEHLPACQHFGIGVYPYSPLARGVLSGKYSGGAVPADSRAGVSDTRIMQTEFRPQTIEAANRFVALAADRGVTPTAYAIAFVLANPIVTGAIVGPRTVEQFRAYLEALSVTWGEEDEAAVAEIVPQGSTAVQHYVDPAYPVEGRPLG